MSSRSGPERTDTHHLLSREKEVADRGREVEQAAAAEHAHLLAHRAQQPQVVVYRHECESQERPCALHGLVRREHLEQLRAFFRTYGDVARGGRRRPGWFVDVEEVEERVGGVRVVSAERLQAELPVHEDDGVAGFQEVFRGRRATRSSIGSQYTLSRSGMIWKGTHQH